MGVIFVDADACPVKDEVYVVATRYGLTTVVVANTRLHVPEGLGIEQVVVDRGPDAADDWIAGEARGGDVVVTADLPLAARCLDAGAEVLSPDGRVFDAESIGGRLASRELKSQLREAGVMTGGPSALSARDRSRFLEALDRLVQRATRATQAGKRSRA